MARRTPSDVVRAWRHLLAGLRPLSLRLWHHPWCDAACLVIASLVLLQAQAPVLSTAPADEQAQSAAQQKPVPPPAQQVPRFRAETNLVRVDAYVTFGSEPVEDLQAGDFEVFEDGVRQKVEHFEYVRKGHVVAAAPGQPLDAAPRGRLFVLFIDTYHLPWVDRERLEHREAQDPDWLPQRQVVPGLLPPPVPDDRMLRDAMREMLGRIMGEEDRVAVLTPDMWAAAPTFVDRQTAIDELATRPLEAYAVGQRPSEIVHYEACFPNGPNIEPVMRTRYRLFRTFNVLQELVANLELLRDERKAVLVVTRGWDPPPRIPNYRDERLTMLGQDGTICHAERVLLADKDFGQWFHSIIDEANRANVAFYSIYAHPFVTYGKDGPGIDDDTRKFQRQWGDFQNIRGMAPPGGDVMLIDGFPAIDRQRNYWHDTLKELSKKTGGQAILSAGDLQKNLTEIADDLSSYYLLGYYSTNTATDGKYRKITVKVGRPKVTVRARAGYRAVMPQPDVKAAEAAARNTVPEEVTAALAPLARLRPDSPFRLAATSEILPAQSRVRLRLVGELDRARAEEAEWQRGWRAEVTITGPGEQAAPRSTDVSVPAGQRAFIAAFPTEGSLPAGEYVVHARAIAEDKVTVVEDRISVTVPVLGEAGRGPVAGEPMLYRRPNRPRTEFEPTADQRFTRQEVLMVEVPFAGTIDAPRFQFVDRRGQRREAPIPATIGERDGVAVVRGVLPLGSIAQGEYVVELVISSEEPAAKVLVAFKVVS